MFYADYKKTDFLNGYGIRCTLFVSGCSHRCKGCFNAPAWNPCFGNEYTEEIEEMIINDLNKPHISGLSLLGGEPFENIDGLFNLVKRIKEELPHKDIWCWSGYTYDQILEDKEKFEFLKYIDILVDGKFEIDKKDLKLKFRGSSNQRVIDVKESLLCDDIIIYLK